MEVSAKEGININLVFEDIADNLYEIKKKRLIEISEYQIKKMEAAVPPQKRHFKSLYFNENDDKADIEKYLANFKKNKIEEIRSR